MSFLELELSKAERRAKKIAANPDPTKMASNRVLYELEAEQRREQLAATGDPQHPLVSCALFLEPLIRSMGFVPIDLQGLADKVIDASSYVDSALAAGLPEGLCDRIATYVIMCEKGDLPIPELFITNDFGCDQVYLGWNLLAHRHKKKFFCVDIPTAWGEPNLQYVVRQLRDLIAFLEASFPGVKYDEAKLVELLDYQREALQYMRDIYRIRRRRPCPIPIEDSFRFPRFPAHYNDPTKAVDYVRMYRDELIERAERQPANPEKLRLLWLTAAPFYSNFIDVLSEYGANVTFFALDLQAKWIAQSYGTYGDPTESGRPLSPLEEVARSSFTSWATPGRQWIGEVIWMCKDLQIDAVVNFMQAGCLPSYGLAGLLKEEVFRETGIPMLNIDGRQLFSQFYDPRFEVQLRDFLSICQSRTVPSPTQAGGDS